MNRLVLALATAGLACAAGVAGAAAPQGTAPMQGGAPVAPAATAAPSADVSRQLDLYRTEVNGRIARGEITADEGNRLLQWREWQLGQQAAGLAPPAVIQAPPPVREAYAVPYYDAVPYYAPAPYYAPYYGYYAPRYYWGPRICAGGWGHHAGGRICI